MTSTERILVFSGLALALGLSLASNVSGSTAIASGPAAAADIKFATVDVLGIVARMLESDRYKQANTENAQKYDNDLRTKLAQLEDIRTRALAMPEGSEQRRPLEAEFGQKSQEFEQARGLAQQAIEEFNTNQVAEAYRLIVDAAVTLSNQEGYTHVVVSRGDQLKIASRSVAGAVQEILARPLIKTDPAHDLTDRLIKQFGLENVVLPDQNAAQPGQPPANQPPAGQAPAAQPPAAGSPR
jgi:Skp family chaperone for outer membrane proteins